MKQIRLFTGGHKFHTEDFSHVQEGVIDSMAAIVQALSVSGTGFIKLSGGVLTGSNPNYTWTEGVVYFEGDFYYLPSNAVSTNIDNVSFDLVEIPEANNPVTYRDGSTKDVHVTTQLSLRGDTAGVVDASLLRTANDLSFQLADRLIVSSSFISKLISNGINASLVSNNLRTDIENNGWNTITTGLAADWTVIEPIQWRQSASSGNIKFEFRGLARYTGGATDPDFFSMPNTILLPNNERIFTIGRIVGGSSYDSRLIVIPTGSGAIKVTGFTGTGDDVFCIDNISYWKI